METRRSAENDVGLARLALKRVAVRARRAMVVSGDPNIRAALTGSLPRDRFHSYAFPDGDAAWEHFQQQGADLVLIERDVTGITGTVLCDLMRKSRQGSEVALLLIAASYGDDPRLGAGDCSAFGADGFVPLPCGAELLFARIDAAVSRREPVERLGVLPPPLARSIDSLYARLDKASYYELVECSIEAPREQVQAAFHRRSLVLHPDRHQRLKSSHPHAWEKINAIYKRLSEAYRVLMDPAQRHTYNIALRNHSSVRLSNTERAARVAKLLEACRTGEAREAIVESLELRALGDLEGAQQHVARALGFEPGNAALLELFDAIGKLLDLMRRGQ